MVNLLVWSQGFSRNHSRCLRKCTENLSRESKNLMRFGENIEIYEVLFTEIKFLYIVDPRERII